MIKNIINFFKTLLNPIELKTASEVENYSGSVVINNKKLSKIEITNQLPKVLEKKFLSSPKIVTLKPGTKLWRFCEKHNSVRFSECWFETQTMEQILTSLRIKQFHADFNKNLNRKNKLLIGQKPDRQGFCLQIELKKDTIAYIGKTKAEDIFNEAKEKYSFGEGSSDYGKEVTVKQLVKSQKGEMNQIIIPSFSNKMLNQTENEFGKVIYLRAI